MRITAVLDSSTFNDVHFNPTYGIFAEKNLFEGINSNGFLMLIQKANCKCYLQTS